jgi:macrolide transport system ATP-binding/permease protein
MRSMSLLARVFGKKRDQRKAELERELRDHLELEAEDLRQEGRPADEAGYAAQHTLGNTLQVAEAVHEVWGWTWLDRLMQDLRFGFRILRRNPGFSLLAILCLALGIGANAAVFSWIEGILFRPYPLVVDQDRLVAVTGTNRATNDRDDVSWPDFLDFQRSTTLIDSWIAEKISGATLSIGDRAEWAVGSVVSANYFDALGVRPSPGRSFRPEEGAGRNAHPVVVISYKLWKNRFSGDPEIVGKTQSFNSVPYTIIGVAPEGFYGTFVGYAFDFWVPASMQEKFDATGYKLEDRGARWIEGFARLKPGVTLAQAQEEISAVAKRLENDYPATNRGRGVQLFPLWQTPFNNAGALLPTLGIAMGVVFFVLLIACANVSNLLLVRAFARRHEMTVRLAVGAGRSRLLRQLLTEGVILSALAAIGGLAVAYWFRNALVVLVPFRGVPMYLPGTMDWRVLVTSVGVALISTVVFGLVPALQTSKVDLAAALKAETGGVVGGRGKKRFRSGLVLVQVSLSFVLLVGAGLLLKSMQRIRTSSPGFSTEHVLVTGLNLFAAGYNQQQARNFEDELMDRLQALSGVESAAYGRIPPFSYAMYSSAFIQVSGYEPRPDEQPSAEYNEVSPGYFSTLGIPLVSGRDFSRSDDETAQPVAIVNETMATQFWHGQDPAGKLLQVKDRALRVIGVARSAKYRSFVETPRPFFYVPLRQNPSARIGLFLRTQQGIETMMPAVTREVHALDSGLAPSAMITMREQVDRSTSSQRIAVTMLSVCGLLALLLAAVGLYGVMSYVVSQSTRELGLRMALGANAGDVLRLVMSHGLALTTGGVVLGAAAALALTRRLGSLLFNVSPRDPLAFATALGVMTAAALVACFFPAWKATRTDPVRALRD